MSEWTTPRQMIKAWLQGEAPPRPLLMPMVFSLGARLENLALREFQSNPTKIANALRQIRSVLKVDGVTCYFDPFLEAEALGCKREWRADNTCTLKCPPFSGVDSLRGKLISPDRVPEKSNVPVATEVIRRLRTLLKDEPALTVRITGPCNLAAQLVAYDRVEDQELQKVTEFAAEVTASVAKSFLEAGADVVFLVEDSLPEMASDVCQTYASLLAPIVNLIRFYEAMPVLLFGAKALSDQTLNSILDRRWDCLLCPAAPLMSASLSKQAQMGVALPSQLWQGEVQHEELLGALDFQNLKSELVLLTSDEDVAAADVKQLARTVDILRAA
jgi:uroporphyrinogen-III decarboxylase